MKIKDWARNPRVTLPLLFAAWLVANGLAGAGVEPFTALNDMNGMFTGQWWIQR